MESGTQSIQVQIVVEHNPDDIFTSSMGTPIEEEDPSVNLEDRDLAQQRASLATYLKSMPYPCETEEQMHAHLEHIVGRIVICAETKNWPVLHTWDGLLECWLLLRYPISKSLRAKLVKLYYELALLPGIEARITRSWVDIVFKLLAHKSDGRKKLEASDLSLPWRPLWRVIQKEIWWKGRVTSRKMATLFLNLAEHCRHYFLLDDIPEMLNEFVPLMSREALFALAMPVLTSFLPLRRSNLYTPMLFNLWEASNSSAVDDRLMGFLGALSEANVAGAADNGDGWKDVGIWTESQWSFLVGKALGFMNVPVGGAKSVTSTSAYADVMVKGGYSNRVKKPNNAIMAVARIFVYSMSVDGPVRPDPSGLNTPISNHSTSQTPQQHGYLAGSKALDTLDRLITSTETYFHPSNAGIWSLTLMSLMAGLTAEFLKRWQQEELPTCKTPVGQRLTPAIRRAFVSTLRTPVLLAMFAKDSASLLFAQSSIRHLTVLEPKLMLPELLERAYGGLESVNETHRTTAVLSMLASIIRPLVNEQAYLGGQKHIVPLLELCIPGIDLNDPNKTIATATFISYIAQHIKIGDLSSTQSGAPLSSDEPPETILDTDSDVRMPDGSSEVLSRAEERTLVRESTAGFADWVTSFLRRVLALFENLPEEGGKSNTTGGRSEENVLKSLHSALDMVILNLSEPLFDLVLKIVDDYAKTNAKQNARKAFGQLVASLGLSDPAKTAKKLVPHCIAQIKEELKHGASSVRSTSITAALPSDTTLHWNITILRACFVSDGRVALEYKDDLLEVLTILQEKTLSEQGYSATGFTATKILAALSTVYPFYGHLVNTDEWSSPDFDKDHNTHWGRTYKFEDVNIEWHIPSDEEISFVIDVLDSLVAPALDNADRLLDTAANWDNIARNDFCRYLSFCGHAWDGLPTFVKEDVKEVKWSGVNVDAEMEELVASPMLVSAGFALSDPADHRWQKATAHRKRFGEVLHRAARVLNQEHKGEDHTDAILAVNTAMQTYLTAYGVEPGDFTAQQKAYMTARESSRIASKKKFYGRLTFVRRAHLHHSSRAYLHALYRRRDALDDDLIQDIASLSLSPYLRVRRQAQSTLRKVCGIFVRSTLMVLPKMFGALTQGTDPDCMKGALYVLWNKGTAMYAIADSKDPTLYGQYLLALLGCQHQEKPSIQQLVSSLSKDALGYLEEESIRTDGYEDDIPGVKDAIIQLTTHFSSALVDQRLLLKAEAKGRIRRAIKLQRYDETVASIVQLALQPTTHWRYVHWSLKFLFNLLRRDAAPSADAAKLFMLNTTSPHSSLRSTAQKGIVKLTAFIKCRTYSKSSNEIWLHEWSNPLQARIPISSDSEFFEYVGRSTDPSDAYPALYIDKILTGLVAWRSYTKAYKPVDSDALPIEWEEASQPALRAIEQSIQEDQYFRRLGDLWAQESNRDAKPDIRHDNVEFMKSLSKILQGKYVDLMTSELESLLSDSDRFKQRASAEFIAGITRGSKHWPKSASQQARLWAVKWLDSKHKESKPDTIEIWESCFIHLLDGRDPRRMPELASWVLSLPTDFQGESAFTILKSLGILNSFVAHAGFRDPRLIERHFELLVANMNLPYGETRHSIADGMFMCIFKKWTPCHPSVKAFLDACQSDEDPLRIRNTPFKERLLSVVQQLPVWKEERLPPPRVNQSQYDKVSLTLLRWVWAASFSSQAPISFPYILPLIPEFLKMTELSDSPEVQVYSQAILSVLPAVPTPPGYVDPVIAIYVDTIKSSKSWRTRLNTMRPLVMFFYRNLLGISEDTAKTIMDVLLLCLSDDNVEVREMASKSLSGVVRVSQRQSIASLLDRFRTTIRKTELPSRRDEKYAESIRTLHSAVLGLCALVESFPYSVEKWMPPLTDIFAAHATDPPPISTTIRKTASEFKKTHQDTWHKDQLAFDEEQLQNLSTMLVGTSYYA